MPLPPFAHFPAAAAGPYGHMNPMLALATANGLYGHGGHGGPGHPRGRGGGGGGGNMRGGMRGFDNGNWGEEFTTLLPYRIWLRSRLNHIFAVVFSEAMMVTVTQ